MFSANFLKLFSMRRPKELVTLPDFQNLFDINLSACQPFGSGKLISFRLVGIYNAMAELNSFHFYLSE